MEHSHSAFEVHSLAYRCRLCAAGYHPVREDDCEQDVATICAAAGGTEPVQAPTLRMTLPASWDENWLASPAVVDLDNDSDMEIVASRHSVLCAWDHTGAMLWRAAWSHNASDPNDHGATRMWASPAIGDFDGDGDLEIAVGSDADGGGSNVAVYDHTGELMPGWPQHFGDNDEVRSITAGDLDRDGTAGTKLGVGAPASGTAVHVLVKGS